MRSLLITGSGSKFTKPILRRLEPHFDLITLLSKNSPHPNSNPKIIGLNFDLSQSHEIPVLADVVIHLAAIVPYNSTNETASDLLEKNIQCFINVMRYASEAGVRRVVLISSTDVYPLDVSGLIRLNTSSMPHNIYGVSKLACERIGLMISEMTSVSLSILRVGPIYSESEPKINKVSQMLALLREHRPIAIPEPHSIPSLLHIESAVDAIVASVEAQNGTFLIAGRPISIGNFFKLAKDVYCSSSQISYGNTLSRSISISFDTSDSEIGLGWSPFSGEKMFGYSEVPSEALR
jgi:nucleoside-diphosphate-sugar epimerase